MKRLTLGSLLLALLLGSWRASVAHASSAVPPPPPPPPPCRQCDGPPPPPTPVPTLAPTVAGPTEVLSVQLSPAHVARGRSARLAVTAASGSLVTIAIRYRSAKPAIIRGKVGSSRTFARSWVVPRSASPGKTMVQVTVESSPKQYSARLWLVVTK